MKFAWLHRLCRSGATLLEALITALLGLLILGVVAQTVREYGLIMQQNRTHDQRMDLWLALQQISREASAALSVTCPNPANLVLTRTLPGSSRLPLQRRPQPLPALLSWDPRYPDPSWIVSLTYAVVNGQLVRLATFASGPPRSVVVQTPVQGFSASLDAQKLLQLEAANPGLTAVRVRVLLP